METKYTRDGKKVAVVGELNSTEFIVQEIFVTEEGDEIPSGERFTVKTLLDTPMETYASKEEARINKRVAKAKEELERLEKETKFAREKSKGDKDVYASMKRMTEGLDHSHLEQIIDVISGRIEYVTIKGYDNVPKIQAFNDTMIGWDSYYGNRRYDDIKLLTLYGTKKKFRWGLNRYNNGSGSETTIELHKTYEDAVQYVKDTVIKALNEEKLIATDKLEYVLGLGIRLSDEHIDILKKSYMVSANMNVEQTKKM